MHSSMPSIGNHVVRFAKQYREGELQPAGRALSASSRKFRRLPGGSRSDVMRIVVYRPTIRMT